MRSERILGVEELDYFEQEQQWFTASYRLKAPDDEVDLEPLHGLMSGFNIVTFTRGNFPNYAKMQGESFTVSLQILVVKT